jgi:hypothetical protein
MHHQRGERSPSYWEHLDHLPFEIHGILSQRLGADGSDFRSPLHVELQQVDSFIYSFACYLTVLSAT